MPLEDEIKKAFEKLIELAAQSPHREKVGDLIAYQIGWGKCLIRWYEDGVLGNMPQMPGEGFEKWDYKGLAEFFHKKYRFDCGKKQMHEFEKVYRRILKIIEKESDSLELLGVWEWCTLKSGKQWPLSKWIRVNTVAPYKRAAASIKKANQF